MWTCDEVARAACAVCSGRSVLTTPASRGAKHHHHHHDDDDDDEVKTEQHLNELRLRNKIIDESGVNASSVTVASE